VKHNGHVSPAPRCTQPFHHPRKPPRSSRTVPNDHALARRPSAHPTRIHLAHLRTHAAQQPHALPNRASDATVPLAPPILITPLRVILPLAARAPSMHYNMRDRLRMKDHCICSLSAGDWTSVPFSTCGLLTCQRHGWFTGIWALWGPK
jgi:hypothetical protein